MVDSGIKKVTVPLSQMIPISEVLVNTPASNTKPLDASNSIASRLLYLLRYRITSFDGTKFSPWSAKSVITSPSIRHTFNSDNDFKNTVTSTGTAINATWNIPSGFVNTSFDVYARWVNLDDQLSTTSPLNTITNKAATSGVATITTGTHGISANEWVSVYGVDSIFNGYYQVVSVTTNTITFNLNTTATVASAASSGTIRRLSFETTYANNVNNFYSNWQYVATTTANSFHIQIPTNFVSTISTKYSKYIELYVQVQSLPQTLTFSSDPTVPPTAILNNTGRIFNTIIPTYSTATDSGILF